MGTTEQNKKYYRKYTEEKRQMNKAWYQKNKDKFRAAQNEKRRSSLVEKAGYAHKGVCEVCGTDKRRIHFDHDHHTGAFRGWLCTNCNTALGLVGDNVSTLARLIEYLDGKKNWLEKLDM